LVQFSIILSHTHTHTHTHKFSKLFLSITLCDSNVILLVITATDLLWYVWFVKWLIENGTVLRDIFVKMGMQLPEAHVTNTHPRALRMIL
jgi:hypothetical protein